MEIGERSIAEETEGAAATLSSAQHTLLSSADNDNEPSRTHRSEEKNLNPNVRTVPYAYVRDVRFRAKYRKEQKSLMAVLHT